MISIKKIALIVVLYGLSACGVDSTQYISFEMYGIYSIPTGAEGDTTPQSLTMNLTSVTLVNEGGADQTVLYSGDPVELTIIDRAQLVYQKDLSDYEDSTFIQSIITFDTSYAANVKDVGAVSGQLTSGSISYELPITIETGKSITFSIKTSWQNIVQDGALVAEPSFEMVKD